MHLLALAISLHFLVGMNHPTILFSESKNCIANSLSTFRCGWINALILVSAERRLRFQFPSSRRVRRLPTNYLIASVVRVFFSQRNVLRERRIITFGSKTVLRGGDSIVRYPRENFKFAFLCHCLPRDLKSQRFPTRVSFETPYRTLESLRFTIAVVHIKLKVAV